MDGRAGGSTGWRGTSNGSSATGRRVSPRGCDLKLVDHLAAGLGHRARLTRFAPAPTGYLHVGHVVNAIYVWGIAGALRGDVLLRIEDHDRQRCRPEFEAALLDDLGWLGFIPDLYPTDTFRAGTTEGRQSDRDTIYRAVLAPLLGRGLLYGCECARKDLTGERGRYPGTCRERGVLPRDGVGWRVRLAPGEEVFEDGLLGVERQTPAEQCGDVLIRDRLGNWTYQWAASADDTLQRISLVVRGRDLLDSTGRQMAIARLLGRVEPPVFVHHPLIMKSPTQKVSKSDRDTGVRDLREAGWTATRVIGDAAWRAGLIARPDRLAASDMADLIGDLAPSRQR
ncbi:MAG: glutamate--tRNA ligase family protein [Acidobacteriota bacterium]